MSHTSAIPSIFYDEVLFEIDGFTAQLCLSQESKELAYKLRYRAYLATGQIKDNDGQEVRDDFDKSHNSRTHLIWYDGDPIASVRSSIWSQKYEWSMTESIRAFWYDAHCHIGLDHRILESSRYVVEPTFQGRNSLRAQLLLFRLQDLSSAYDQCDHIITSVREKHVPFYQRMLSFKQISDRGSVDWIDCDIVLLSTTADESRRVIMQKGMPACTEAERERYASLCITDKVISHA